MCKTAFDIEVYFEELDTIIHSILSRPERNILTYDILDTELTKRYKLIALRERHRQMKIGEIWQEVLGRYSGYINLKIGHSTGLDIISHSKKIAIELKNRTNTDNASSKKSNFDKLTLFKKNNPEYRCIYANINDSTQQRTMVGFVKKIIHNDVEIEQLVGYKFLKFVLGDDTDTILQFVKETIDKYSI